MSSDARRDRAARIREVMTAEGDAVAENTRGFNRGRYESVADLDDYEALKDEARAIKEDAIERLPELIETVEERVAKNGGTVYLADDAADANRYIREVVADRDADRLVKSKSMTSEEIEVNDALADAGVDVVETDLGEWVLQVADEAPSHIVAPAIHKSRDAIAELFAEKFDPDDPPKTAAELTAFAREKLGDLIADADVGMTGANFVAAESGTIALVTSEGNARKTVAATDTQIAVAGVEKLVPTVGDVAPFAELIGRSGTGQDITSYLSLLTPPVPSPVPDFDDLDAKLGRADAGDDSDRAAGANPDREFHLVLIDNGRQAMREDETLRETLYCIRCGACSNACGNFQSVGGHVFGGETYSGGIATGWEAGVEGLDVAAEFNDLCTGCTRCVPACPVNIDIPWINTAVRDRINREGGGTGALAAFPDALAPDAEPSGLDPGKRLFGSAETLFRLGSATAPVSNRLAALGPVRAVLERAVGLDRRRDLPTFSRESLVDWFHRRGGPRVPSGAATREAVLYPDVYTNYADTDRGKAAVRALEALDVRVLVPSLPGSGRAPLSQGMVETARGKAAAVADGLAPHLAGDRDVVVVEPSALAAFHREYERLLDDDAAERIAGASYDVLEYVYGLLENGGDPAALTGPDAGAAGVDYHPHCQGRTLGVDRHAVAVLERLGYDVRTSDTECCGMAGSFGYKSDYYELSMDVGEPLIEQFGNAGRNDTEGEREPAGSSAGNGTTADGRRLVASGTSCVSQLETLLNRPADHPIELIAPD